MGQVITLMPLIQQTIILEDSNDFLNQVGGKSGYSGTVTKTPTRAVTTTKQPTTQTPSGSIGGGTSIGSTPTGSLGSSTPVIDSQPTQSSDFGFNIADWNVLSCEQVISETNRLKNIRAQKIARPAAANQLLDANIAIGNSIIQNECTQQPSTQMPEAPISSGGEFGITGGFGESGFGESGFGGDDFQQPTAEDYEVLGYDKTGCPIYGYDENGTPLYGVDLNGNIITDPTVLPCAMKAMRDESPIKQIASDVTFRTSLLVLGGIALVAYLAK